MVKTSYDIEQGGLAASGGSEQYDDFSSRDVKINAAQGMNSRVALTIDFGKVPCAKGKRYFCLRQSYDLLSL